MQAVVFQRPRHFDVEQLPTLRTDGLITHRFALDRFGDAIETVRSDPRWLKAVVEL